MPAERSFPQWSTCRWSGRNASCIADGVKAAYHGGPGTTVGKYSWEHKTMYLASDPVALDRVGWSVIDAKRVAVGMRPVGEARPDADSRWYRMQPEHVEIAAALGLGEVDEKKIDLSYAVALPRLKIGFSMGRCRPRTISFPLSTAVPWVCRLPI